MTLRLTVQRDLWLGHVRQVAAETPHLGAVVKGNGYGFGRQALYRYATEIADHVFVGTIHELDGIPAGLTPVVLTPCAVTPQRLPAGTIRTVSSTDDIGRPVPGSDQVLVKLRSSMHRFGVGPDALASLTNAVHRAGLAVAGFSIHLPLAGSDADRAAEVDAWVAHLPPDGLPLWVSHLGPETLSDLAARHPQRTFPVRVGSRLWHGDKQALRLQADVLAVQPVRRGDRAGYRLGPVDADGHIVLVGAGSAHGVGALDDGRSPVHFARTRLALHEPPHMHTTMCFVPAGEPLPDVGAWVDVQRPLTLVAPDETVWV